MVGARRSRAARARHDPTPTVLLGAHALLVNGLTTPNFIIVAFWSLSRGPARVREQRLYSAVAAVTSALAKSHAFTVR